MKSVSNGYKQKLLDTYGNICSICGNAFDENDLELEHRIPISAGGDNSIENLCLICHECHRRRSGFSPSFLSYEFEAFIKGLLERHPNYSDIRNGVVIGDSQRIADFVFERRVGQKTETVVAETKATSSFTIQRIQFIIDRINQYRQHLPEAKYAFIFTGKLPENYAKMLHAENIEVWDSAFLSKEFKEQIENPPKPSSTFVQRVGRVIRLSSSADKHDELIKQLKFCPPGTKNWGEYQKLVGKIIEVLFCPPLEPPLIQNNDGYKKNRRDFILANYTLENSIWKYIREKYHADFIVVDAKNSGKDITKSDVLQIGNYLKPDGTGMFALIISRLGSGPSAKYALREKWLYEHKMIIILNDDDIEQMLLDKKLGNDPAKLILKKIEDFRLSI